MCRLRKITYVFTQGSISSEGNSQSTLDAFPTVSQNRRYKARGSTTLPPFIAGDIQNIRIRWHSGKRSRLYQVIPTPTVLIPDGTLGLKHTGVIQISAGHTDILSGSVTTPVPLRYDICGGSDQVGFGLSITLWQHPGLDEMHISQTNIFRLSLQDNQLAYP